MKLKTCNPKFLIIVTAFSLLFFTPGFSQSSHCVGDLYGGGIIVSTWKVNGTEHGLIASLENLNSEIEWSKVKSKTVPEPGAKNYSDGLANSNAIEAQSNISAAHLCRGYSAAGDGGLQDWYLPSIWELSQCYNAAFIVNTVLGNEKGFSCERYWSSTESDPMSAFVMNFVLGCPEPAILKGLTKRMKIRAVRRF